MWEATGNPIQHPRTAWTAWNHLRSFRVVTTATLVLLLAPVLIDLTRSPTRRPFGYVAADTFYYLTVARNIARHGVPSYDGAHATNAFHPAWQAVCGAIYFLAEHAGLARHTVLIVVLVSLALVAAAVFLLAAAFERNGTLTASFVVLPLGVYSVLVLPIWFDRCMRDPLADFWNVRIGRMPLFGSLWSYANGMESGLLLFCFALLALSWVKSTRSPPDARGAATFGVIASAVALARLDHALLVLPVLLAYAHKSRGALRFLPLAGFALPIGVYLLTNRLLLGVAFPVSGAAKSSFPYFNSENLRNLLGQPPVPRCSYVLISSWRSAAMCVPMLVALVYLALSLRVRSAPGSVSIGFRSGMKDTDTLLIFVAFGVLALGGYNFLFVPLGMQGHWYFPVSTLFVSLATIAVLERMRPARESLRAAGAATVILLSVLVFVGLRRSETHASLARFYWEEAPRVRAHYAEKAPNLLECDDGIVSFSLDGAAMSAMLAKDPESTRARDAHQLLALASRRGFDHLATLVYEGTDLADLIQRSDGALEWTRRRFGDEDLSAFDFTFDYVSPLKDFAIVRMTPKPTTAAPSRT